jgi:hypothetical protein
MRVFLLRHTILNRNSVKSLKFWSTFDLRTYGFEPEFQKFGGLFGVISQIIMSLCDFVDLSVISPIIESFRKM